MPPKKLAPVHPGEVLLEEFLKPMGISQNRLALAIGVHSRRINEIVLRKRAITADTALTRYEIVRCLLPSRWPHRQRCYGETIRARGTWEHAGRAGRRSGDGLSTRAFSWPPLRPGLDALRARIRWCRVARLPPTRPSKEGGV